MCNTGLEVNLYKQACRNKGSIGFGILENRVLNLEGPGFAEMRAKPYKYIFLLILYT